MEHQHRGASRARLLIMMTKGMEKTDPCSGRVLGLRALLLCLCFSPNMAHAKLSIVTTTPDLAVLSAEIGGDQVTADAIAKGTQDPHAIEAKPSFMLKASKADLVVSVGLELEIGWLKSILQGSRNPKVMPGNPGYLEVGPEVDPLEVPEGKITRKDGDVHPAGNPHVTLDPIRIGRIALVIAKRMGQLEPESAKNFLESATRIQKRLEEKTKQWQARIDKSGVRRIVTYHKTLSYFLDRFKISNPAILEPKPGIPPTSGHIINVIKIIQEQKVPLILVENYFDPSITRKIMPEVPSLRVETVPVSVGGTPSVKTLDDLYETLVKSVEGRAG
jgi:zinc/manganese transport system substrate-binding protein